MAGMGSADNPVRLWPFRRLVAVHWPKDDGNDYLAIKIGIVSAEGTEVTSVDCFSEVEPTPGYNYYGSSYGTDQTYNYELLDQALYTQNSDVGEWGPVGEPAEVTGLRTTDTETVGGVWEAYRPPFGGRGASEFARFTPITDESGPVIVPDDTHNFGGVGVITAEYLCGLYAGDLGCVDFGPPIGRNQSKGIESAPVPLALTIDLAASIVVTYLEQVLPLVGMSTERPSPSTWVFPIGGPATVELPTHAWLLYRIPASSA